MTMLESSRVTYVNPGFDGEALRSGGLALLMSVESDSQDGLRKRLGNILDHYLSMEVPRSKYLQWEGVDSMLHSYRYVPGYLTSGQSASGKTGSGPKRIGPFPGYRYVLIARWPNRLENQNIDVDIFPGTLLPVPKITSKGSLTVDAQVWDTERAEVVWAGYAETHDTRLLGLDSYSNWALHVTPELLKILNWTSTAWVPVGVKVGKRGEIEEVASDSPAEKAGLQTQDVIQAIDDVYYQPGDAERYRLRLMGKPGTPVKVSILREGKKMDVTLLRE